MKNVCLKLLVMFKFNEFTISRKYMPLGLMNTLPY